MKNPAALLATLLLAAAGPVAPTIIAGQILTPTIDVTRPPPAPRVRLHISGPINSAMFTWNGPSGQYLSSWFVGGVWGGNTVFQATNTATPAQGFELAFNLYTQPGKWSLSNLQLCRNALCTNYGATQLAALFPNTTLQINNPNPYDVIPPVATAANITTPTISLSKSPIARVSLAAKDNLSGIYSVGVQLNLPGVFTPIYVFNNAQPADIPRAGTFPLASTLPTTTPTGTYTITSVFLEDYAGNTTSITDTSKISTLFNGKVTITITN